MTINKRVSTLESKKRQPVKYVLLMRDESGRLFYLDTGKPYMPTPGSPAPIQLRWPEDDE